MANEVERELELLIGIRGGIGSRERVDAARKEEEGRKQSGGKGKEGRGAERGWDVLVDGVGSSLLLYTSSPCLLLHSMSSPASRLPDLRTSQPLRPL